MRKTILACVSVFLFISLLSAEDPIVKQMEIRGLRRIDEFAVKNRISQRVGSPLSSQQVNNDIKEIFRMGYFDDVRVDMDFFEGGIKLIYILKEKPAIRRISFYGNEEFEDEKLNEQITFARGSIADVTLINENALKIKAFYESEGYWLAEVTPIVREVSDTDSVITFLIREGNKVKISTIEIEGNRAFDDDDIKDEMETSEWWFLSFITSGGYYSSSIMQQDRQKIKNLYYNNGYINVRVSEPEVSVDREKGEMSVRLTVSEGDQYSVSKVEVARNRAYSRERLFELVNLKQGDIFSRKVLSGDIRSLTDFYSNRGYALVSIDPEVIPDTELKKVAVTYNVIEGDIFHIGRIEISGNTKTKDKVIRREMRLDEGDVFSGSLIRRSYQRLNNLNFFEGVQIEPKPKPQEKLVDIDIEVKEKQTGSISVGGGYSTTDKVVGMIDLTQANLFGNGQYLKLKTELGGISTTYDLSFTDPWFLDKPLSMTVNVYRTEREYVDYSRKATGFGFGIGKPFGEYWRAKFSYNLEEVDVFDIDDDASETIRDQEGVNLTSSISQSFVRDSRDYHLDPHKGSKSGLYLKLAGLGGDNQYFKGLLDSGWFFPVGPTTIAFRARLGYAKGIEGRELPLYEGFYCGGINTVRGLDFGECGPLDENGEPIGGEKEIIFNLEYIFPLVTELQLKGLVFFDAGRAFDDFEDMDDIRYTTGAGVRWLSPMGPMRFEWGYNLDRREGENQSKVEFTFGTFF